MEERWGRGEQNGVSGLGKGKVRRENGEKMKQKGRGKERARHNNVRIKKKRIGGTKQDTRIEDIRLPANMRRYTGMDFLYTSWVFSPVKLKMGPSGCTQQSSSF